MNKTVKELEALFFATTDKDAQWEILSEIYAMKARQEADMMTALYNKEAN